MLALKIGLSLAWGVCIAPFGLVLLLTPITFPAGVALLALAAYPLRTIVMNHAAAQARNMPHHDEDDTPAPWFSQEEIGEAEEEEN